MTLYLNSTQGLASNLVSPLAKATGGRSIVAPLISSSSYMVTGQRAKFAGTTVRFTAAAQPTVLSKQTSAAPTALELQARLRARWPIVMARSRELPKIAPDPVQSMIDLLGDLPGDYATWREILEELYG